MERCFVFKIVQRSKADLANSHAIAGNPRLELDNFIPQPDCPRKFRSLLKEKV